MIFYYLLNQIRSTCTNFPKTNRCLIVTLIPSHMTGNVIPFGDVNNCELDSNTKLPGVRQATGGVLYRQIRSFKVFFSVIKIFRLTEKYDK